MAIATELEKLRRRAGLSMTEMARQMGFRTPSGYQRYEDPAEFDAKPLPFKHLREVVQILKGRGSPPITVSEIYPLFGVNQNGVYFLDKHTSVTVNDGPQDIVLKRHIPFIRLADLTRTENLMARPDSDTPWFATDEGVGTGAIATEIIDESGAPDFPRGTAVVIDPDAELTPGCFVLAMVDGEEEAKIGRYALRTAENGERLVEVTAINPHYPSFIISRERPGRILGRVVRSQRRH